MLILRLRTGEVVALVGSVDPHPTPFALMHRGPGDTAEVVAHFRELTRFRAEDVTPI